MKKYYYKVMLNTELGKKKGTMNIHIHENKVEGLLNLLKHSEPIYGTVDIDGSCQLHGKIVTLLKELAYVATGHIGDDNLNLNLQIGTSRYLLMGILSKSEII